MTRRRRLGHDVAKAAFWFPEDVLAVLDALKAQTGMSKSQLLRDLVMSLGAGKPIEYLPDTKAIALALDYWRRRAAAGISK
jgi:hypothetical protein